MKAFRVVLFCGLIGLFYSVPVIAGPSTCDSLAGNLVLNCGFETGDFTDWIQTPAAEGSDFGVTGSPNSGTFAADFGATGGLNDYIDQFLTTTAGQSYTVSFYVDASADVAGQFVANWNGTNILTIPGLTGTGYQFYSFTETATSTSTDLQFGGNTPPSFYYLDDVAVTSGSVVPEPSSIWLAVVGLFGIFLMGRRCVKKPV